MRSVHSVFSRGHLVILSLPLIIYGVFFHALRPLGAYLLFAVVIASTAAYILDRTRHSSTLYNAFIAFSASIFILSILDQMPSSWTLVRDEAVAFRQWIWIPLVPIFVNCFTIIIRKYWLLINTNAYTIFIAIFVLSRISRAYFTDTELDFQILSLYSTLSDTVLAFIPVILRLTSGRASEAERLIVIICLAALSSSASSLLFLISLIFCLYMRRHIFIVTGLYFGVAAAHLILPIEPLVVFGLDPNAGVRALMWKDAWAIVADTLGAGIGYGTEYIRNRFYLIGLGDWRLFAEGATDALFISTHSTHYDVLIRNGAVGFALFIAWFVRTTLPVRSQTIWQSQTRAALSCMLLIYASFNPTFVSIGGLIGMSALVAAISVVDAQGSESQRKYSE